MSLIEFYKELEFPDKEQIRLEKNIIFIVPDKDFDIKPVLKQYGLSKWEVAVTWPKENLNILDEVAAASPKFVLQIDCKVSDDYWYIPKDCDRMDDIAVEIDNAVSDTYVGLHHHDEFSIKDGLGTVDQLIKMLKVQRRSFVSITNHGSVGGWIKQYNSCKKHGLKAIFGCEFYVTQYRGDDPEEKKKHRSANHLVLLAKTMEGFENIIKIHNDAQIDGFYYTPRTIHDTLKKFGKGVIASSACLAGEFPQLLLADKKDEAKKLYEFYKGCFDEFYIEIQIIEMEEQRKANRLLIEFAKEVGAPLITSCDCLASGSRVVMRNGTVKAIEKVVVGDEVSTDDGHFSIVDAIGNRDVRDNEAVYDVFSGTKNQKIRVTENHPFLIDEDGKRKWIRAEDLKKGNWLVIPRPILHPRKVIIQMDDYFDNKSSTRAIHNGKWVSSRRDKNCFVPEKIIVDNEFCWVLGMYIAEGFRDRYNIGFGLHKEETEYANRIIHFFERYGFHPNNVVQGENGRTVRITSFGFSPLFESLCGDGANKKHLPSFWKNLNKKNLISLLDGVLCGDGSWSQKNLSINSVSEQLVYQLQQAFLVLGYWGGIYTTESRFDKRTGNWNQKQYGISFGGPQINNMRWNQWSIKRGTRKNKKRACWHHKLKNDCVLVKVDSVLPVVTDIPSVVYDLQVRNRHSFIVEGRVVHNSHYLEPEHAETHDILMCIRQHKTLFDKAGEENEDLWSFDVKNLYYRSEEQMRQVFENGFVDKDGNAFTPFKDEIFTEEVFREAASNTRKIALSTEDIKLDSTIKLPKLYDDAAKILKTKANAGFKRRKLDLKPNYQEYVDRLQFEYEVIKKLGWSDYFLVVEKIISDTVEKFGEFATGWGRGCFHPCMRVVTGSGIPKFIGQVRKGDIVVSHDGTKQKVLDIFEYNVDENLIEIETNDGRVIRCTPDHEIWVNTRDGRVWKEAQDLQEGDDIVEV